MIANSNKQSYADHEDGPVNLPAYLEDWDEMAVAGWAKSCNMGKTVEDAIIANEISGLLIIYFIYSLIYFVFFN